MLLDPTSRARLSLEGLSLGDAFGERFFAHPHTTCAIVGGIVALRVGAEGLPPSWLAHREPLPMRE